MRVRTCNALCATLPRIHNLMICCKGLVDVYSFGALHKQMTRVRTGRMHFLDVSRLCLQRIYDKVLQDGGVVLMIYAYKLRMLVQTAYAV